MAMTIGQITQALAQESLRYVEQDNTCLLMYGTEHYCDPEGEKQVIVCFGLDENGDRLNLIIPKAFSLAEDTAIRGQVLKILMARQYQKRYVRCEFDPRDGEIRLSIDLILEDNFLSADDLLMHLGILLVEVEAIYQKIQPLLHIQSQAEKLEALYRQESEPRQPLNFAGIDAATQTNKEQNKGEYAAAVTFDDDDGLFGEYFETYLKPEQKQFLETLIEQGFTLEHKGAKKQTMRIQKDGYDYGYVNRNTINKGFFGYKFNVSPLLKNRNASDHCPASFIGDGDVNALNEALKHYFSEKYGFSDGWYVQNNKSIGKFYITITDLQAAKRIVGVD